MESGNYAEWRYENFSCWNSEIHGNCLEHSSSPLVLYPRGFGGDGDHLIVKVYDADKSSGIELYYIGSDGSIICKQELQEPRWERIDWSVCRLILPPGPKFEDVVRTRKNKDLHKDILTLRLYRSDNNNNTNRQGFITIDVNENCLRTPVHMFKNVKLEKVIWISDISLNNEDHNLTLNASLEGPTLEDAEMHFTFIPDFADEVLIRTAISLLDSNDIAVKSEENEHLFRDKATWDFFSISNSREILGNGLAVMMSIKYISGTTQCMLLPPSVEFIESISTEPNMPSKTINNLTENIPPNSPVMVLTNELMCLYQDQDFSDIQLKCGNISIPVHKNILSARSIVFKTMFSTDMRESVSSEVDIEDLDFPTLSHFLTFLYTAEVEDLQCDSALNLYYAADKYQVPSLMKECAGFLCANVSISNVCDILSLADKHQDHQLTSVAHNFILKNYNAVLISEEWKDLLMNEPLMCAKTLTQFVEQNRMREIKTS